MLPWCLGRYGLNRSATLAYDAGFQGLQILPMRGWDHLTFSGISSEKIISFELAWNCGPLGSAIIRSSHAFSLKVLRYFKLGALTEALPSPNENRPLITDWFLFGNCDATERRAELMFHHFQKTSMFITHDVIHAGVVEMHPELDLEVGIYANYPYGLVWDTEHVIRSGRHGQPPVTDDWEKLLDEVGHNIRLIHVKDPVNPKMLEALAKKTTCPVIFETRPPLGKIFKPPMRHVQKRALEWLTSRRNFLGYFFD